MEEEIKKPIEDVIIATTEEFIRLGYDQKQAIKLAKMALMYQDSATNKSSKEALNNENT